MLVTFAPEAQATVEAVDVQPVVFEIAIQMHGKPLTREETGLALRAAAL